MRSAWTLALAACGCRGLLGIQQPIDATDSAILIDEPAACTFWHPQGVDPCALGVPARALTLAAGQYVYDTTTAAGSYRRSSRATRRARSCRRS